MALDLVVAGAWASYAWIFLAKTLRDGNLVHLGQAGAMTVFAVLFLLRRPARRKGARWETVLAVVAVLMPILLRPAPGPFARLGEAVQICGLIGMVGALLSLGRSFGVAPADRGLRTTGLYAWVRHPLYAAELLVFAGFLVAHPSGWNVAIVGLNTLLQVVRITREERIIADYAAYAARVRWRLIPMLW
ncbi:MAG TPA: methyltransferase [Candidatus Binatia bacterium]|nr:methyltransferase [Candidatus Binatia bacterium]